MYSKKLVLFLIVKLISDYSSVVAQSDEENSNYVEQIRQATINACNENDAGDKISLVEHRFNDFESCASRVINQAEVIHNLVLAKLIGNVAETTMGLCAKSEESKACATKLNYAVAPCTTTDDQKELNILITLYKRAVDFACFQNGTALTQFVEQDGLACLATQYDQLSQCIDAFPNNVDLIGLEQLSKCVVAQMARCRLMPALILHGMFGFVHRGIPNDTLPATTEGIVRRIREAAQDRL